MEGSVLADQARLKFFFTLVDGDEKLTQAMSSVTSCRFHQEFDQFFKTDFSGSWKFYSSPSPPAYGDENHYRLRPGSTGWPSFEMLMFALLERRRHQNRKLELFFSIFLS
jgi:hypothetical protein